MLPVSCFRTYCKTGLRTLSRCQTACFWKTSSSKGQWCASRGFSAAHSAARFGMALCARGTPDIIGDCHPDALTLLLTGCKSAAEQGRFSSEHDEWRTGYYWTQTVGGQSPAPP